MSRVVGTPGEMSIKTKGSTGERSGAYKQPSTAILDALSCLNIELVKWCRHTHVAPCDVVGALGHVGAPESDCHQKLDLMALSSVQPQCLSPI